MRDCDYPDLCIPHGDNFKPCNACPNKASELAASTCSEAVAAAAKVPNDALSDALHWTESYLAEIKRRMNQNEKGSCDE